MFGRSLGDAGGDFDGQESDGKKLVLIILIDVIGGD